MSLEARQVGEAIDRLMAPGINIETRFGQRREIYLVHCTRCSFKSNPRADTDTALQDLGEHAISAHRALFMKHLRDIQRKHKLGMSNGHR